VLASALASLSSAVVGSIFGVAGTVVGAAVGGVVITTGRAAYEYWLRRAAYRLRTQIPVRVPRRDRTRPEVPAEEPETAAEPMPNGSGGRWRSWWHRLSRRRVGLLAATGIVVASVLGVITAVELITRNPVSSVFGDDPGGRTSVGSLFDDGEAEQPRDTTTTTVPAEEEAPERAPDGDGDTVPEPDTEAPAPRGTPAPTAPDGEPSPDDQPPEETPDDEVPPTGSTTTTTTGATQAPSADDTGS